MQTRAIIESRKRMAASRRVSKISTTPHMKNVGVLVLTVEGLQHIDGGVGRYLWNIVDEAPAIRREWLEKGIRLSFYAAEPICNPDLPVYRADLFTRMDAALRAAGGRAFRLANLSCSDNSYRDSLARDPRNFLATSAAAAQVALELGQSLDALVVISGLSLFAQVPMLIRKQADFVHANIKCVHMTHSPTPAANGAVDDLRVQANEALGELVKKDSLVKIGFESEYMRRSYQERYSTPDDAFVYARSGIPIDHEKFSPLSEKDTRAILQQKGIPLDKPLVVSWGRSDAYKGYDILLKAVKLLDNEVAPVVLNSTYNPTLHELKNELGVDAVLLHEQPFQTISALLQWQHTRVAAFLSQNEPAAVTPAEAMLASHGKGCVVLAVPNSCFPEMINHGKNGFLAAARTPEAIADSIKEILTLPKTEAKDIGAQAVTYARTNHDFAANFRRTLELLLTKDFTHARPTWVRQMV